WSTPPGPAPTVLFQAGRPVRSVVLGPDGRTAALGCDNREARVCDIEGSAGGGVLTHPDPGMRGLRSPDRRPLLTAHAGGVVRVWDATQGRQLNDDPPRGKRVRALAFSPDSRLAAAGGYDGTALILEAGTGARRAVLRHDPAVLAAAFSPDGARLLTGGI